MFCRFATLLLSAMLLLAQSQPRHHRSEVARRNFKRENPCPSTGESKGPCPGYVIDHITPLACGGEDAPDNMQWQSLEDAKAKDKWERKDCVTAPTPSTK